jgi:hypothetical protein
MASFTVGIVSKEKAKRKQACAKTTKVDEVPGRKFAGWGRVVAAAR